MGNNEGINNPALTLLYKRTETKYQSPFKLNLVERANDHSSVSHSHSSAFKTSPNTSVPSSPLTHSNTVKMRNTFNNKEEFEM